MAEWRTDPQPLTGAYSTREAAQAAWDACADDEHSITVPRTKQGREAAA